MTRLLTGCKSNLGRGFLEKWDTFETLGVQESERNPTDLSASLNGDSIGRLKLKPFNVRASGKSCSMGFRAV